MSGILNKFFHIFLHFCAILVPFNINLCFTERVWFLRQSRRLLTWFIFNIGWNHWELQRCNHREYDYVLNKWPFSRLCSGSYDFIIIYFQMCCSNLRHTLLLFTGLFTFCFPFKNSCSFVLFQLHLLTSSFLMAKKETPFCVHKNLCLVRFVFVVKSFFRSNFTYVQDISLIRLYVYIILRL